MSRTFTSLAAALALSTAVSAAPPFTYTETKEMWRTQWKTYHQTHTTTVTVAASCSASSSPSSAHSSTASSVLSSASFSQASTLATSVHSTSTSSVVSSASSSQASTLATSAHSPSTSSVHSSATSNAASTSSSSSAAGATPSAYKPAPTNYWPGWAGISHMVVFGDSYTTTGFNVSGAQPSEANPLGNPPYPGYTATNGPNWVDFLTTTYNKTFLETINLAYGGATVDSALVKPYLPTVLSLKEQVQTEYLPLYANHPSYFNWQADNTLFASFLGINDVGNAYGWANASAVFDLIFKEYASLMDQVYQTGARNFLFLNVPPVDRAPLTVAQGASAAALEASTIAAYNVNVTRMAANLSSTYSDAKTFVFDTNAAFTEVLNNPCSHMETCPYKNTTDYCAAYANGTPSWYTFNATCGVSVDEYFWLNSLHPTFRMMNVTAQEIAGELS